MKKAIAMKCTREDWDSIKGMIPKEMIYEYFESTLKWSYLTNNFNNDKKIAFTLKDNGFDREIHETFNAKIFLEACGIETRPTLEEVKEYFKDGKEIESADLPIHKGQMFDISDRSVFDDRQIHFDSDAYWLCKKEIDNIMLWSPEHGYAKILTYKEQKFEITKEQILELAKYTSLANDWFPEVFKKELEVWRWYKVKHTSYEYLLLYSGKNMSYGFSDGEFGNWSFSKGGNQEIAIEATLQEVETALINEAKRRGYVKGVCCNNSNVHNSKYDNRILLSSDFTFDEGGLFIKEGEWTRYRIFDNGNWAAIIETITIQEAEKFLKEQGINKKIV